MRFVQKLADVSMAPTGAGMIVAHEAVGQGADAEERRLTVHDHAARRVKTIPVQAQIEPVVLSIAIIDFGKKGPVVAKTQLNPEIRLNSMKRVRHVLQVLRIVSVWRIEIPRNRENAVGSREFRIVGRTEAGLIDVSKAGVDRRDRVLLSLLFVVGEEPQA